MGGREEGESGREEAGGRWAGDSIALKLARKKKHQETTKKEKQPRKKNNQEKYQENTKKEKTRY